MLNLNYSPVPVVDCNTLTNEDWLEYRKRGIGGSEVSVLFGVNPWTTKLQMYRDKVDNFRMDPPNQYTLDFGHAIEPFVAEWFAKAFHMPASKYKTWLEKQYGEKIIEFSVRRDTLQYKHPFFPFLVADLDFRCTITTADGKEHEGVFECKTTNAHSFADHWGWNRVPEYYVWQCRHYMCVTNTDFVVIACASGNNEDNYAMGFVRRDLDKEEELILTAKDFWENNILARVPPATTVNPNLADGELGALIAFNKTKNTNTTEAFPIVSPQLISCCTQIMEIKEKISEAERLKKSLDGDKKVLEAKLYSEMNGHMTGTAHLSDGSSVSVFVKETNRTTVDGKKLQREYPEVYTECQKKSSTIGLDIKQKSGAAAS